MPGIDDYKKWIGRTEVATQVAELWPVTGLYALLDKAPAPKIGDPLPPCGHWLYFTPMVRQSKIGFDGHPERGDFLPAIVEPRRMWAASDITFHAPIRLGDELEKTARIADVAQKVGATGALIFVTVENDYRAGGELALSEKQTIVYRDHPRPDEVPPPPKPAPEKPDWSRELKADPVMLFRYSAVTFNGHRIHYDHPYVTQEEGYPNIIVQGQLIATLLLDTFAAHNPGVEAKRFSFRAMKPLFSGEPFFAEGASNDTGGLDLWSRNGDGHLTLSAKLEI
jgi:3-methylfumaryl-CoA hydratase